MDKKIAETRIQKLKQELWQINYAYYVLDRPIASDAVRDRLKDELEKLEKEFPEFITSDSPTQRIGGKALGKFEKITHTVQKYSLDDVFAWQEVLDFDERVKKLLMLKSDDVKYTGELKIDGLNMTFIYKKGLLFKAVTRGDGLVGEDVTHTIRTIKTVPLKLKKEIDIEVGGEIYMPLKSFEKLNLEAQKNNPPADGQIFANPRNAAAGTVRQLDPLVASSRDLQAFFYAVYSENLAVTQFETLENLKELGFRVEPHFRLLKNIHEAKIFFNEVEKIRTKLSFEIDGVVVKVNNLSDQEKLGRTAKCVRWACAYKFKAKEAITKVLDIVVQVGRTGAITPVCVMKPVEVAGSVVSRATLHNEDEIKRLNLKIGDTVVIQKAGDVIPDIIKVLENLRDGTEKKFSMPKKCPICDSEITRKTGEVAHYCTNKNCFAQNRERLYHFVSRGAFNIDGMGPKIIDQLLNVGLIKDASDIFSLKQGDLTALERFGEKSASNLIGAIKDSCKIEIARFIYSLGIRHVGEETAVLLTQNGISNFQFPISNKNFIKNFESLSLEELNNIDGIGDVVAESIYDFFHYEKNIKFLKKLFDSGVEIIVEQKSKTQNNKFTGKSFVLTGTLSSMPREIAKEKIRFFGGKIVEPVSAKTDFVIVGENPGSKYTDAKKLNIKILSEKEFLEMVK